MTGAIAVSGKIGRTSLINTTIIIYIIPRILFQLIPNRRRNSKTPSVFLKMRNHTPTNERQKGRRRASAPPSAVDRQQASGITDAYCCGGHPLSAVCDLVFVLPEVCFLGMRKQIYGVWRDFSASFAFISCRFSPMRGIICSAFVFLQKRQTALFLREGKRLAPFFSRGKNDRKAVIRPISARFF